MTCPAVGRAQSSTILGGTARWGLRGTWMRCPVLAGPEGLSLPIAEPRDEPVNRVRDGLRRRTGSLRGPRGRPRARLAVHAAGPGVPRPRRGRAAPAARADRRARRGIHRTRAGQGEPPPGRHRVHVRHGGGELPPGCHRGVGVGRPAARAHRRPPSGATRHRREPDDRPGQAVRRRRPLVRRPRSPRAARWRGRGVAVASLPGLCAVIRRGRHLPRPRPRQPPLP